MFFFKYFIYFDYLINLILIDKDSGKRKGEDMEDGLSVKKKFVFKKEVLKFKGWG